MPPIPQNVRLLVRKNEEHARAERHCKDLQMGASVSQWHERALLKTGAAGATTDRLALRAEQEQQASERGQTAACMRLPPSSQHLHAPPALSPPTPTPTPTPRSAGSADQGGQAGAPGEAGGAVPPGGAAVRGGAERPGPGTGQAEGLSWAPNRGHVDGGAGVDWLAGFDWLAGVCGLT
jgi:hypothetical protein